MKKKLLIIFCFIVAFAALAAGAYFITKAIDTSSAVSAADFLISGHEWQKSGEESVIWTFEPDGICRVTANSTEVFDCDWRLADGFLTVRTKWLTPLTDEFTLTVNQSDNTFTVVSNSDNKSSTFTVKK